MSICSDFQKIFGLPRYNHTFEQMDFPSSNYFGCAFKINDLIAKNGKEIPYHPFPCFRGLDRATYSFLTQGGEGKIYRCEKWMNGSFQSVILKIMRPEKMVQIAAYESIVIDRLKKAKVRHVVDMIDAFDLPSYTGCVFMDGGTSIYDLLEKGKKFSLAEIQNVVRQVLEVLDHLRSFKPPIVHCDLTSDNVLLSEKGDVTVIDWNSARNPGPISALLRNNTRPHACSPEHLLGSFTFDTSVDIWSLGCLFFEMATGDDPFKGKDSQTVLNSIQSTFNDSKLTAEGRQDPLRTKLTAALKSKGCSPTEIFHYKNLLFEMLKLKERVTPKEAMQYKFLRVKL